MSDPTHHVLDGYATGASERLGPGTHCSITMRRGELLTYVGSSDERAERCDQVEVRSSDGPCVDAMLHLSGIIVPDLQVDTRWPAWREAALDAGFRSAAALPGVVDNDTTVALNMYSDLVDPWDRDLIISMDSYIQEIAEAIRTSL
jgi:hypothetical protein